MYDVLVKNGRIVTADSVSEGNIAIRDGKIAAVLNAGEEPEAAKVIDAKGNYVFPGAIDTHAHLNDPGYEWREDYEHGTAAAALGGYTTVIDMPLQNEPAMVNAEAFDFKLKKVDPNAYCDYCFWGGLIPDNFKDLKDLDEKGCVAFKSFIGPVSPDYSSLNYGQAYEAMEIIKEFDGRAGFHCEDFSMIKNLEKIEKAKDPAAARAYIYGFICHFALDSECHPYVEKIMQVGRVSHNEIEMELDRMMLTEDYHDPLRYLTAKHIQPKMEYAEVIAPFFKDVTAEQIYKALKGMVFYHKLFLAPTSGKRKALFLGMKAVGKYDSLHDIVMSVKPDPLCQKYCKVLKRQYSGAVPLAASLIVQYQKKLFQDTPLPERFHETFGAGEEWEKLRL